MDAVILDIDGTLIESAAVDNRLYMSAVGQVLGRVKLRDDWTQYAHVTDTGLLQEIMTDNQIEGAHCIDQVKNIFFNKLEAHLDQHGPFSQLPGARKFVESLVGASNHSVAYATGGWQHSARMKLARSGFPLANIPLATSDDYPDRKSIMAHALDQLVGPIDKITYYGDGLWDQHAASDLGWHFVAVGRRLNGIENFPEVAVAD